MTINQTTSNIIEALAHKHYTSQLELLTSMLDSDTLTMDEATTIDRHAKQQLQERCSLIRAMTHN